MKAPQTPRIDERRAPEFLAELEERARAWIPSWGLTDGEHDFGRALLEIAARFNSEVVQRLDGAGEKMRRGFLDWLAVRGQAARPSRMPVVFKLADTAREGVLASAPVRMQADAGGTPVVFETEKDVRIVPGQLDVVVGIDADNDAFYLPPPGLNDLNPLESLPTQWQLKSFAAAGVTHFQLDPEAGLLPDTIIEAGDQQYRIVKADKDLVTIDRPLVNALAGGSVVTKVTKFSPFDGRTYNQQQHVLYLGDSELLNIEAEATIDVVGAFALREGFVWQYWGKLDGGDEENWQPLGFDKDKQEKVHDAVVLTKPKGEIVEFEIGGKKSRWIRAYRKTVGSTEEPFTNDQVGLRLNFSGCADVPCPRSLSAEQLVSPAAEAMANTSPLPQEKFYPLGREPRQFDTFYLGSQEAFSKKDARIQLCFEMAEAKFRSLTWLGVAPFIDKLIAGVAADGFLHLLQFDRGAGVLSRYPNREPLRPPSPGPGGVTIDTPSIGLDSSPLFRAPIWVVGVNIFIGVTAANEVWIWRENTALPLRSGWEAAGRIGAVSTEPIHGLVHLDDAGAGRLFALRESKLYVRNLNDVNPTWTPVKGQGAGAGIALKTIAPIAIRDGTLLPGTLSVGLVGVDDQDALYGISLVNSPLEAKYKKLLDGVATDVAPAAVRRKDTDNKLVVVAVSSIDPSLPDEPRKLLGFLSLPSTFGLDDTDEVSLDSTDILGPTVDVNQNGGHLTFVTCTRVAEESTSLAAWTPFETPKHAPLFSTTIPNNVGMVGGAPTLMPKHVIVPTTASRVIVAAFDASVRLALQENLLTAVISSTAEPQLIAGDRLAIPFRIGLTTRYQLETIPASGVEHEGQTLYEFAVSSSNDPLFAYRMTPPPLKATVNPANANPAELDKVKVDANDSATTDGAILLITTDLPDIRLYKVVSFDPGSKVAKLDQDLVVANTTNPPATVDYRVPDLASPPHLPLLRLTGTTGNWDAGLLNRTSLVFPEAEPELQNAIAFEVDLSGHPVLVVLTRHWSNEPPVAGGKVDFIVDPSVGSWTAQLGDTLSNPELSWEFWDGEGWSRLNVIDGTLHLKTTGNVTFDVPRDLAPSDWAGKTNYWIRARLVGGDYGREKVTVKIKNVPGGTEQTVVRSTEGIRPPKVLKLSISYANCKSAQPTFVLAEDSGTVRDQSDANRTPGAIVEAFIPLALTLGRLTEKVAETETTSPEVCPPDCDCKTLHPKKTETSVAVGTTTAGPSGRVIGREIYIGLAATPSEAPVNVLLLVEEQKHTPFAPMTIEALVADRFAPIVVDDATRALGESGVLSMTFAVPPTRSELFGKKDLTWLRLIPKNGNNNWIPTLRGAYLNAAWASATETLTRELLGSSDGAPNLTVRLARPPVLRNTLELRVKEPLGEEEREALLKVDAKSVLSTVEGLPGDWVLWKQVTDPDDELATAPVYALDEASGEIRFGDGSHGKIPPIGRDSIVAFTYGRTEPDPTGGDRVPGNTIEARAALNLVSPVETVESVTAADQAAGGAPPESDERVLRFGFARLRHRSRAVTAEDLEDLASQSSPDIAQARAFVRRGFIRLVIVMRGKTPVPTAAQIRELRRLLLDAAPASLSAPNVLRIEGPRIRRLRIDLQLLVETLDHAGQLSSSVKKKLTEFFDTATGGLNKDGWALGAKASEEDIALAISDAPYLESIENVKLLEITEDGKELPSLEEPGPREIVMLADDPIRIQFETAEVTV